MLSMLPSIGRQGSAFAPSLRVGSGWATAGALGGMGARLRASPREGGYRLHLNALKM